MAMRVLMRFATRLVRCRWISYLLEPPVLSTVMGRRLKARGATVWFGGSTAVTELREQSDPYCGTSDAINFDDGEDRERFVQDNLNTFDLNHCSCTGFSTSAVSSLQWLGITMGWI